VSVVVRKLYDKGMVGKTPSSEDRRRLKVTLTAAGSRIAGKAPIPVQQVLLGRMAQLPPDQLRTLADLLERVAQSKERPHSAPMFFDDGKETKAEHPRRSQRPRPTRG
jgi:hypothetical protein